MHIKVADVHDPHQVASLLLGPIFRDQRRTLQDGLDWSLAGNGRLVKEIVIYVLLKLLQVGHLARGLEPDAAQYVYFFCRQVVLRVEHWINLHILLLHPLLLLNQLHKQRLLDFDRLALAAKILLDYRYYFPRSFQRRDLCPRVFIRNRCKPLPGHDLQIGDQRVGEGFVANFFRQGLDQRLQGGAMFSLDRVESVRLWFGFDVWKQLVRIFQYRCMPGVMARSRTLVGVLNYLIEVNRKTVGL